MKSGLGGTLVTSRQNSQVQQVPRPVQRKPQMNIGTVGNQMAGMPNPITLTLNSDPIELDTPKELESEVNSFFHNLLYGSSNSDDMVKTVYEYAVRGTVAQRKLLDGILKLLAIEFSSHLNEYPEELLLIISDFYGSILAGGTQLLSMPTLSMLWRAFLTCLYSLPPDNAVDTPIIRAVVLVLVKAKSTLSQFINIPSYLVKCPVFKQFSHELQERILAAESLMKGYIRTLQQHANTSRSMSKEVLSVSSGAPLSSGVCAPNSAFHPSAPPERAYQPPDQPDEAVSDRISFLFNNVSKVNVKEKSIELADVLSTSTVPWFANYLVSKRIIDEPTFHELFATVLDSIHEKLPDLRLEVISELLRNIRNILRNMRSDKDDLQARKMLKHLGSFLGLLTLARNKPVLHDDISLKSLIFEAYYKGPVTIQYVVPFVSAIVGAAAKGVLFCPPNPWTMAILKVLRELYDMHDVNVKLRFEIETLFDLFKLNLEEVASSQYLCDRNNQKHLEIQLCHLTSGSAPTVCLPSTGFESISDSPSTYLGQVFPTNSSVSGGCSTTMSMLQNAPTTASTSQQQQMLQMLADNSVLARQHYQQSGVVSLQAAAIAAGQQHLRSRFGDTTLNAHATSPSDLATLLNSNASATIRQPTGVPTAFIQAQLQSLNATTSSSSAVGNPPGSSHSRQLAEVAASFKQQQLLYSQSQAVTSGPSGSLPQASSTQLFAHNTDLISGGSNQPFRYEDVNINCIYACLNMDDLLRQLSASVNSSGSRVASAAVSLLHSKTSIRNMIQPAIEKAVNELIAPVFERCSRITVPTVTVILRKDFALDPDPNRLLTAAKRMARHLTVGISLITAREVLCVSLVNTLKSIILGGIPSASSEDKEAIECIALYVVDKSMAACLAYMQKTVAERVVAEVARKLEPEVKRRNKLGPRLFAQQALEEQANITEYTLRNPSLSAELTVYDEFGRNVPGFAPVSTSGPPCNYTMPGSLQQQQRRRYPADTCPPLSTMQLMSHGSSASVSHPQLTTQPVAQQGALAKVFENVIYDIDRHSKHISTLLRSKSSSVLRPFSCLIDAAHQAKTTQDANVVANVIATVVRSLLDNYRPSHWLEERRDLRPMEHLKEAHIVILRGLLSDDSPYVSAWVNRQVTQTWITLPDMETFMSQQRPTSGAQHGGRSDEASTQSSDTSTAAKRPPPSSPKPADSEEPTEEKSYSPINSHATDDVSKAEATLPNQTHSGGQPQQSQPVGGCNKWNLDAFAELLKLQVIHLPQVDMYLAEQLNRGYAPGINFLLGLLDRFVLPTLNACDDSVSSGIGYSGFGSSAPSSTAASNSGNSGGNITSPQAGVSGNVSSFGEMLTDSVGIPSPPTVGNRRELFMLHEYDFWCTIEAMQARINYLDASNSTLDQPSQRLRVSCAHMRALLDLGMLEHMPFGGGAVVRSVREPTTQTIIPGVALLYAGCSQFLELDDPPNFHERTTSLLHRWLYFYKNQHTLNVVENIMTELRHHGMLVNEDMLTRFLRRATILVTENAMKQFKHSKGPPATTRVSGYTELDAYARLLSIIIMNRGIDVDDANSKLSLLNKVLGIVGGIILKYHKLQQDGFHPIPFERILVMLFVDLYSASSTPMSGLPSVAKSTAVEAESTSTLPIESTAIVQPVKSSTEIGKEPVPQAASSQADTSLTLLQHIPLAYGHLLHLLRPERATNFVFSWIEMLAHRHFVNRTLAADASTPASLRAAYQAMYAQLIVDLLKFLGYFLQNALLERPIICLYTATLRLFLILIHDFSDFVSDYCTLFCDVVPSNSIQMCNLILSASPKRLLPVADPLQAPPIDQLATLEDPSGYCMDAGMRLPQPMKAELDAYLTTRAPMKLLSELVTMLRRASHIQLLPPAPTSGSVISGGGAASSTKGEEKEPTPEPESSVTSGKKGKKGAAAAQAISTSGPARRRGLAPASGGVTNTSSNAAAALWGVRAAQQIATFGVADGMHYNVELMTNLTLYICITAIHSLREKGMPLNMTTIAHTPQMDIIQSLVLNLDNEGRYLLLNCMVNQLRYPNSHTYYFSYTILYLFSEQSKEEVKEQISRVLMERLVVNRPHPWGLLMTSVELLRNPAYRFWEHEFARCNPEIEKVVANVASSCIPNFQMPAPVRSHILSSQNAASCRPASNMTGDNRHQTSHLAKPALISSE